MAVDPQYVCGAAHERRTSRAKPRQNTLPEDDCTRPYTAEKSTKSAPRGSLSLDNGGPHKGSVRGLVQTPGLPPTTGREPHRLLIPPPISLWWLLRPPQTALAETAIAR